MRPPAAASASPAFSVGATKGLLGDREQTLLTSGRNQGAGSLNLKGSVVLESQFYPDRLSSIDQAHVQRDTEHY